MIEIINSPGYFLSKDGAVYSKKFKEIKQLKIKLNHKGYKIVILTTKNKRKGHFIHRLLVQHYMPEIWNDSLQVNHKDGNKLNNNLENLEMITNTENMRHAIKNGLTRHVRGSEVSKAIINQETAQYIKEQLKTRKARHIANELNISEYIVYHISLGRTWRHV